MILKDYRSKWVVGFELGFGIERSENKHTEDARSHKPSIENASFLL
jgi:hypothetical protein